MVSKWVIPIHLVIMVAILWWFGDYNRTVDIIDMMAYISGIVLYTLCKGE